MQQHVVERQPGQELLGVGDQAVLRAIDADEILEVEQLRPLDRPQAPRAAARVPAERRGALEQRGPWREPDARLEGALGEAEHPLESIEDPLPAPHVAG